MLQVEKNNFNNYEKWATSIASLSLIVSTIFSIIYVAPFLERMRGMVVEFLGTFCILGFWASFILTEFNRNGHGMTNVVLEDGTEISIVENGNKYYCSWFSLIACILLFTSYIQSNLNIDNAEDSNFFVGRFALWFLMLFCSVVIIGDASGILVATDCTSTSTRYCTSIRVAIGINTCTSIIAVAVVLFKLAKRFEEKLMRIAECVSSALILVGHISSIHVITGPNGVGEPLDNIFHFTWLSLANSIILAYYCSLPFLKYYLAHRGKASAKGDPSEKASSEDIISGKSTHIDVDVEKCSEMSSNVMLQGRICKITGSIICGEKSAVGKRENVRIGNVQVILPSSRIGENTPIAYMEDLSCIKEHDEEMASTSSDMVISTSSDMINAGNVHRRNTTVPSKNVTTSETYAMFHKKRPTKSRGATMVTRRDAAAHQKVSPTRRDRNSTKKVSTRRDRNSTKKVSFSTSDTYLTSDGESYTPIRLRSDPAYSTKGRKRNKSRRKHRRVKEHQPRKTHHTNTSHLEDSVAIQNATVVDLTSYVDKNGEINLLDDDDDDDDDNTVTPPPEIKIAKKTVKSFTSAEC